MNKIKDFIYDKNDLLIALLILVIASLVIISRIEIIMAYPSTLIAELNPAKKSRSSIPYVPSESAGEEEDQSSGRKNRAMQWMTRKTPRNRLLKTPKTRAIRIRKPATRRRANLPQATCPSILNTEPPAARSPNFS